MRIGTDSEARRLVLRHVLEAEPEELYDESGVITSTECYDVKDTTADQIYKDLIWSTQTNAWVPKNTPTPSNLKAMRETWHMSMRKWIYKANKTRLFLSGYRSSHQMPCGSIRPASRSSRRTCAIAVSRASVSRKRSVSTLSRPMSSITAATTS